MGNQSEWSTRPKENLGFELGVNAEFSAAHRLPIALGGCDRIHGHNFKIEVVLFASTLKENEMSVDFLDIQSVLKEIIQAWDHQYLNELPEFKNHQPTAEWMAKTVFEKMQAVVQNEPCEVKKVTLWENQNFWASYGW